MKKYLIAVMVLIFAAGIAYAETPSTWHPANQVTVAWDAVTSESGAVQYVVYRQQVTHTTGEVIGEPVEIVTTANTQAVITFDMQGAFILGAKTQLVDDAGTVLAESTMAWSNDPAACANGETFGIRYFVVGIPGGLRLVK
jgi:hypothetical protein